MAGHPLKPLSTAKIKKLLNTFPGYTQNQITLQDINDNDFNIDYVIEAFKVPIDSSSMTPQDWVTIAQKVLENYAEHDGFVVLHGTDTMAWTSSALSYLMSGLTKPLIVTGSQIPFAQTRNDGLRNLTTAVLLAATTKIPEACLFFNVNLMRGNRAVKVNSSEFKGFESPKFQPLAVAGIDITVNKSIVMPQPPKSISLSLSKNRKALGKKLAAQKEAMSTFSVASMILFPGIRASMVEGIFEHTTPDIKGMVLGAFGEGDAPSTKAFLDSLAHANKHGGVTIVDGTQCLRGSVNINAYESAAGLKKAGVISGYDLTPEAILTKLIYLISSGKTQAEVKKEMQLPLHGDLTPD